jgi:hypothetical protein
MKRVIFTFLGLILVSSMVAGDDAKALKSGPQAGQRVPGPFHPDNITGENAGKKHCLYCEFQDAPVAMIFAREMSPGLAKLIKSIDTATAKNKGMASCVVFLSNDVEKLTKSAKAMAEKEGIKSTILAIDTPAGPEDYKIARDADVTVLLYTDYMVAANYAFKKGELNDQGVTQVVTSLPKILAKK